MAAVKGILKAVMMVVKLVARWVDAMVDSMVVSTVESLDCYLVCYLAASTDERLGTLKALKKVASTVCRLVMMMVARMDGA